jgi:hypothetical protein
LEKLAKPGRSNRIKLLKKVCGVVNDKGLIGISAQRSRIAGGAE